MVAWQDGLAILVGGMALGWAGQWLLHRRVLRRALSQAAAGREAQDAQGAAELARLANEVARLSARLEGRQDETRRLTQSVALLDQQVMQLHLARSPIGRPQAHAAERAAQAA